MSVTKLERPPLRSPMDDFHDGRNEVLDRVAEALLDEGVGPQLAGRVVRRLRGPDMATHRMPAIKTTFDLQRLAVAWALDDETNPAKLANNSEEP